MKIPLQNLIAHFLHLLRRKRFSSAALIGCGVPLLRAEIFHKASAVNRGQPQPLNCRNMLRRAIALIRRKAIAGVNCIVCFHQAVTINLGNNACRPDGHTLCVPLNNAPLRRGNARNRYRIRKDILRMRA